MHFILTETHFDLLRAVNLILAVASLPPALWLLYQTIKEYSLTNGDKGTSATNIALRFLFTGFAVTALFNAGISFLFLTDYGGTVSYEAEQGIVNVRNLVVNLAVFIASWVFFYIKASFGKDVHSELKERL